MSASQLDRELERALASAKKKDEPGSPDEQERARPMRKGNLGLLVVLLVMAGGIVALVMTSFKDAAVYAKNVDQLQAEGAALAGRRLRVEGNLVHGSLERRDQPCEYRFTIKGKQSELPVRYAQCIVPDNFRDLPDIDLGLTIEGKLSSGGGFEASNILTKCPTKYDMKKMKDEGKEMPHKLGPVM